MANPFQYSALGPSEIRLVQIKRRYDELQPVRCRIIHTTLSRCRALDSFFLYKALSYVWGGPRREIVLCGDAAVNSDFEDIDTSISISANLLSALKTISLQPLENDQPFHMYWIDALCINQNDVTERAYQVRLMKEIYSTAKEVVIWLGGRELENRIQFMRAGPEIVVSLANNKETVLARRDLWLQGLVPLLTQPWFRRIWVIQEVAVSREIKIICGDLEVRWSEFINVASWVHSRQVNPPRLREFCDSVRMIEGLRHVYQKRKDPKFRCNSCKTNDFARGLAEPKELLDLIIATQHYESSDERDKIYALLGIASYLEQDSVSRKVEVDYRISPEQVLVNVGQLYIKGFRPLRIFDSLENSISSGTDRPSWIPLWNAPRDHRCLSQLCPTSYHLRQDYRAIVRQESSQHHIKLGGKLIDNVAYVLRDFSKLMSSDRNMIVPPIILNEWNNSVGCTINECFDPMADPVSKLLKLAQPERMYRGGVTGSTIADISTLQRELCDQRVVIVTKRGYIGIAPQLVEVGDRVALFAGSPLPFVLSKRKGEAEETCWILKGQCFIRGDDLNYLMENRKMKLAMIRLG